MFPNTKGTAKAFFSLVDYHNSCLFQNVIQARLGCLKIVSVIVSTVSCCELATSSSQNSLPGISSIAASSSQNSLPGGSFMEANTDMNKDLIWGCTCCVTGCYSNTRRDMELSFH